MSGEKNQTITCKPLGYQQAKFIKAFTTIFTKTFTRAFTKMKCNVSFGV
jgi:hypothetical protein